MKTISYLTNIKSCLSSILISASRKVKKEMESLFIKYSTLDKKILKQMAIDNLKKNNSDVETLDDFRNIIKSLKEGKEIPNKLKSKYPQLGRYRINNLERTLNHCHIRVNGSFCSLLYCDSVFDEGILLLSVEEHPKDSRGYIKIVNKIPKNLSRSDINSTDTLFNVSELGQRQTIVFNGKKLTLKVYNDNKTITFYRGNNKFYLFHKINDRQVLFIELSLEDRKLLNLINPKYLKNTEIISKGIKEVSLSKIYDKHIEDNTLFIIINGNIENFDLSNPEHSFPSEIDMIFVPDKKSQKFLESLKRKLFKLVEKSF